MEPLPSYSTQSYAASTPDAALEVQAGAAFSGSPCLCQQMSGRRRHRDIWTTGLRRDVSCWVRETGALIGDRLGPDMRWCVEGMDVEKMQSRS